ncbi:MAG: hypothetical protein ACOC06_02990 [Halorubrum sp.]
MVDNRLIVLGSLALLLAALPVLAAVEGEPDLSASISEPRVAPGEEVTVDVVVQNRGEIDSSDDSSLDDRVTTARGVTASLDEEDAPVSVRSGTQSIGAIADGERAEAPFRIVVDENVDPVAVREPGRDDDAVEPAGRE